MAEHELEGRYSEGVTSGSLPASWAAPGQTTPPGWSHAPVTLVGLLRGRSGLHPERRAYAFLPEGEEREQELTYGELDRRARAIAALLQREGLEGERAVLLYPPGLAFIAAFLGCQYAGVVAIPAYPPHPVRPERALETLLGILRDAQPRVVLTVQQMLPTAKALSATAPEFADLPFRVTEDLPEALSESWCEPEIDDSTLAMIQYTSGSTGTPKGVMVTHGNMLHNQRMIQAAFGHTAESTVTSWLPVYHDMGLIGNLLQPLYLGSWCVLMSPVAFLQRPFRWLQAISRYRATTNGAPNFAYDLCVRRVTDEQRASIDLSCWTLAYSGSETVRHETVTRFAEAFEPCGFKREAFYPCYGLAEATLIVSGGLKTAPPVVVAAQAAGLERNELIPAFSAREKIRVLVGCGKSLLDQKIAIVDPERLTRAPAGQIGEIWVSGANVSQGYWNKPEETERTFRAFLADTGEGPFLRTGDLGVLLDGELFVTGRLKDLIIFDGRNHFPEDIELTVERSNAAIRPGCSAAFFVEIEAEEHLVVMAEVERRSGNARGEGRGTVRGRAGASDPEILKAVRKAVAEEHDLRLHALSIVATGGIPRTSSGKIQRHKCRAAYLNDSAGRERG